MYQVVSTQYYVEDGSEFQLRLSRKTKKAAEGQFARLMRRYATWSDPVTLRLVKGPNILRTWHNPKKEASA